MLWSYFSFFIVEIAPTKETMPYFQGTFEQRCLTLGAPTSLSFFTTSFSILFLILNIPGNLLVILAVAMDPFKNLRTPFNFLMANLAFADLIVGTMTDPISVYIHWKEGTNAKLTLAEVRTLHMSYFISCTASVLSLATLAVERYLAIRNPHTYRNKFTTKRVLLTIGCIWLISLTLPFVYFEVGYITYAFIFANTAIVLAIAITGFTYSLMVRKFKMRSRSTNGTTTIANKQANVDEEPETETSSTGIVRDGAAKWERKITKMFLVVMVAMLCCYGPSTVFIYTMSFCESCSCDALHWFRDLQFLFVILNSSVNFYCYALRCPRFRNAFAYILRIKRGEAREPGSNSGSKATGSSGDTNL